MTAPRAVIATAPLSRGERIAATQLDPDIGERIKAQPVAPGKAPSEQTQALRDGAVVFYPGSDRRRTYHGDHGRWAKAHGMRLHQRFGELDGEEGHFVWLVKR